MSLRRGGPGRGSRRGVGPETGLLAAAEAGAVGEAAVEAARLSDIVQFAVSAMAAIGDTARRLSRDSARVRVLELEVVPAALYLDLCVRALHGHLLNCRLSRRWPEQITVQIDQIEALLERAIDITATVDIPGELGLPFEVVSTVQSGARAGLASLTRLRTILDPGAPFESQGDLHRQVDEEREVRTSPSARWLLHTASRLLPPASRDRYREEFASDLYALADAHPGSRAQLGHAVRQVAAIWALRRALPAATRPPADPDRLPALGAAPGTGVRPRPLDQIREPVERWRLQRHARRILREQTVTQQEESDVGRPFPGPPRGRHRR